MVWGKLYLIVREQVRLVVPRHSEAFAERIHDLQRNNVASVEEVGRVAKPPGELDQLDGE
jgi:hypothetical protein